ncbi:density-regulated protein DRP1 [Ramicandelaber brevisporus]|nr:density-regulated protein DRP1 [Ramicandelaber brevisporus]
MDSASATGRKTVVYCGVCTLPPEFCEYGVTIPRCKKWLEKNHPDLFAKYHGGSAPTTESATADDQQKKLAKKEKLISKEEAKLQRAHDKKMATAVLLKRVERNKRKYVVQITGLDAFDVDLKKAAKMFATRFACGASVAKNLHGQDEITVQGDVLMELKQMIVEKLPNVPAANIKIDEGKKK